MLAIDKLTYGPTPGLRAEIDGIGVDAWIEQQLHPEQYAIPDAEGLIGDYVTLDATNLVNSFVEHSIGGYYGQPNDELAHATLIRAINSKQQLYELMCDFWRNHFSLFVEDTQLRFFKNRDMATVIRPHALGRFADMLQASAKSPAMLLSLDQYVSNANSAAGVNVNYARELLELHSLGIVDGEQVYTEADIAGVAKVLSGRRFTMETSPVQYEYQFVYGHHDRGAVSILDGGWSRPANPTADQAQAQCEDMINVLAHHPSTARHLAFKICRRFVSDEPPMALVASAAQVYLDSDTEIAPVLRHIFSSPEFAASGGTKLRKPTEQLVATLRALKASVPRQVRTQASQVLQETLKRGGEWTFFRPTPDGFPDVSLYWASTEAVLRRWELAARVANNTLTDATKPSKISVDVVSLLPSTLPSTAQRLVEDLAATVGNYRIEPADATAILQSQSLDPAGAATQLTANKDRLAAMFGLLLAHPSFQHR
jgi:uncharacterized protein (DUF1800 family)